MIMLINLLLSISYKVVLLLKYARFATFITNFLVSSALPRWLLTLPSLAYAALQTPTATVSLSTTPWVRFAKGRR